MHYFIYYHLIVFDFKGNLSICRPLIKVDVQRKQAVTRALLYLVNSSRSTGNRDM